jgi:NADH-quinone oxidoreductase subunit H
MGLFHGLADGAKMLLKENFTPTTYDSFCYHLAPWLAAAPILLVFAVVPFGGVLMPGKLFPALSGFYGERAYAMQVASLDAGVLIVLSLSGIGILGIMLAGWSSNNKFSLLGAARAASQMISYEVALGLAMLSLVVTFGTLDISQMVRTQSGTLFGFLPAWGIFKQPLAFVLFLTASIAENKRVPFDMPECESELVSGYFTEYTAMKMGLFMLTEFITIVVASALLVTLFLGGCNLPYLSDAGFLFPGFGPVALPHLAVVPLQLVTFMVKVFVTGCFMVQIRWTLPRFRYDQLLSFGWKFLLPLAAVNLFITAIVHWFTLGAP